jgi:hypothetical protein
MRTIQRRHALIASGLVASVFLGRPGGAGAQAWVPEPGEGSLSIQFQNSMTRDHYFGTTKEDIGRIDTSAVVFDTTLGITDKLAVDVGIPYIASKYTGPKPHPTVNDDGAYHSTFQDLRFAVRYNVHPGRLAVTPYVAAIIPSHDYEFYAHAAPGRRLRELQIGTYAAKILDPWLPGAFVQARVAYGFTEEVLNIGHNRAMAEIEVGYFATQTVRLFATTAGQVTNGGIDIPLEGLSAFPPDIRSHHDQIDRVNYANVGVGASVALTETVDVFGSVLTNVANRNGHALNRGINVGVTWSFKHGGEPSARDLARAAAETDRDAEARSLVRCVCQRGER